MEEIIINELREKKHKYFLRIVKFLENGLIQSENVIRCNSIKEIKQEIKENKRIDDGLFKLRKFDYTYKFLVYNLNNKVTKKFN